MLRNNNQRVTDRLAKRSFKSNRHRTLIMITAVMLSAFMLFSVLTVGITYFKMQRVQNIRLSGAEFDAILYGLTDKQRELCENNADISACGIAAVAGWVAETEEDSTPNVGLMWADDTYWDKMMKPARGWVKGTYPKEADEIMVTRNALKECGYENLDIGDSFVMTYGNLGNKYTKEFRISGMWDGYGPKEIIYVSEAFYRQSGQELKNVSSGRFYMDFKQSVMTQKEQEAFINSMELEKQQRLFFTADLGYSVKILAGMAGLLLVTCICAYLLIYNILFLSVSGNIRYYGLLQTVGMTGRQIYRLMYRQMLMIGGIGISGGVLLGSAVSFFLIPSIVKFLGIRTGQVEISFNPAVFILTVLISGLTVYFGSRKPVKMAVSVSPTEALGYRASSSKNNIRRTGRGRLLWRMAREQLTRNKKKAGIVILSLSVSLSVFLCLVTLIESQGARTIVSNYMDMDMVIKNDTMSKEKSDDRKQLLDEVFLEKVAASTGIAEVHPRLSVEITVPWEPVFSDRWMREFYETWMDISYEDEIQEYKDHPENFGSFLSGIDEAEFDMLNKTLEEPVNKKDFLNGKVCILYKHGLAFDLDSLKGEKVTCAEYADSGNMLTLEIAGLTDEKYYTGSLQGYPPVIIVHDSVVKKFTADSLVDKAGIRYEEEYDENAEVGMLNAMNKSPYAKDFSYESKIKEMKSVKKAQGNMMGVGIGIVAILALIGILNYVNTVTGNIQSRKVELAILESIGMTQKQIDRMLVLEGALYAVCSLILTAVLGTGITYCIYQSMNYRGVPFTIPVLPMLGMICFILLVCMIVPVVTRKVLERKDSVAGRIRGFE